MGICWGGRGCAGLLLGLLATQAAAAEDPTESIIVTATRTQSSAKTDVPLLETPQNIQVLSSKLLSDQNISYLEDALRNVAGVMPGGYAHSYDAYRIRGFDSSAYAYVDGLPRNISANVELAGVERLEIIKGPSSVLFGRGSPGGLVNIVSKRQTPTPFLNLEASYGSFDSYTGLLDFGGSFTDNAYARLVAHYRDESSFINFHPGVRRLYLAPSFTWEATPDTTITLLTSMSREWNKLIPDQPAAGLVYAGPRGYFPRDVYIGDPRNMGKIFQDFYTAGYSLKHTFNNWLTLQQNVRASFLDVQYKNLYQPLFYDPSSGVQHEYAQDYREFRNVYSADQQLNAKFDTGSIGHQVTAGFEYYGVRTRTRMGLGFAPDIALDLYRPDYSVFVRQPRTSFSTLKTDSDSYGFYLQEVARLTDALTFTAGGRFDTVEIDATKYNQFTPRVGATYKLVPGVVAYASYSKSFTPQTGYFDTSGKQVAPEKGKQYEVGLKFDMLDGRLNTTLALYELTRENVATPIPSTPNVYAVTGEQRSRGFEFDGQFSLATNWELIASYAYTEAKVIADNTIPVGQTVIGVPRHKASLWTRYSIQDGKLRGLSFSGGGSVYSRQEGALPNTYKVPAYALADMNVTYKWDNVSLALNVNNLFDRDYIQGAYSDLFVVPGNPRTFRLTLSYSY